MDDEVEIYLKSRVVQKEIPCECNNDTFKNGKLSLIVTTNKRKDEIKILNPNPHDVSE